MSKIADINNRLNIKGSNREMKEKFVTKVDKVLENLL